MTIAISVKIKDGIVLASDSASTMIMGQSNVLNVYDNAVKIFNLCKKKPIGLITWGMGGIDDRSIPLLVKNFRAQLSNDDVLCQDVGKVSQAFKEFIYNQTYKPFFDNLPPEAKTSTSVGFLLVGYSKDRDEAEQYQISIDEGVCNIQPVDFLITWNGQCEAAHRLILGYGQGLPGVLQDKIGIPGDQCNAAMDWIREGLNVPLIFPAMPLQDAIDLAEFLVDTTIRFTRFAPGPKTVGGPIEIAAISKHEGFRWVKRKLYYSRELNPEA